MNVEDILSLEEGLLRCEQRKGEPLTEEEIAEVVANREELVRWVTFQNEHGRDGRLIASLTFVLADGTEVKDGDEFHSELTACAVEAITKSVQDKLTEVLLREILEQLAQEE